MAQFIQKLPALTALLSSSCCIIQLMLNFFSISCAGFAVLTPYRPILTTFTTLLLSYNLITIKNKRKAWFPLIISIMIMISPEIVQWMNQLSATTTTRIGHYYRIHLDGLGCEACANRIKNTLTSVDWISNAKIYFDNKTAIIEATTITESNKMIDLIKSIDNKYDAQVLDSWAIKK